MKKTGLIITIFSAIIMLVGCISCNPSLDKKISCNPSLDKKAEKEMRKIMVKMAKYPKSVKIEDVETVYLDDSLCILNYNFIGNNSLQQKVCTRWEYVYQIESDGKAIAFCTELVGDVKSVLSNAKSLYRKQKEHGFISENDDDLEYKKWLLSIQILGRRYNEGYYIVGDDDTFYKLDKNGEVQMYTRSYKSYDDIDTW